MRINELHKVTMGDVLLGLTVRLYTSPVVLEYKLNIEDSIKLATARAPHDFAFHIPEKPVSAQMSNPTYPNRFLMEVHAKSCGLVFRAPVIQWLVSPAGTLRVSAPSPPY